MPHQGIKAMRACFQQARLIVTGNRDLNPYAIGITHARRPHDPRIYAALDWYGLFGRSRCAGPGLGLFVPDGEQDLDDAGFVNLLNRQVTEDRQNIGCKRVAPLLTMFRVLPAAFIRL